MLLLEDWFQLHDRLRSKKIGEFDESILSDDDIEAALRQELQENDDNNVDH